MRQKGSISGWEGRWRGTGRSRRRENCNQDILCEEDKSIFNKRRELKKKKKTGRRITASSKLAWFI